MGRGRFLIQIFLALVLAGVAGIITFKFTVPPKVDPTVITKPEQVTVPVVVAKQEIPMGTRLASNSLKIVPYLKESLPEEYFSDPKELEGRYTIASLTANQAITQSRLAPPGVSTGGISLQISPGMRALAVKGNKVMGLAGFIRPGNRIDVLATLEDQMLPNKVVTKTVLENLRVLATGTEMEEDSEGQVSPVDTYTLELTPEQGEMLSLAATKGTLHFALRNPMDDQKILTMGADILGAVSALKPVEEKPKPKIVKVAQTTKASVRPEVKKKTVEVIRGTEVSQVEF